MIANIGGREGNCHIDPISSCANDDDDDVNDIGLVSVDLFVVYK